VDDVKSGKLRYRRILLKLSGEALCGQEGGFGIDTETLRATAAELGEVHATGVQIGIVVGGGNIFRGSRGASQGKDRAQRDYMGMLATLINSLALQDAIEREGVPTRVMTALEVSAVAEPYIRRRAKRHLEKNRIVILAGGTGAPFVTTDTAAAQKAMELDADILMKATRVDGVYSADPEIDPTATLFRELTFKEVRDLNLRVMDPTAIAHCMEHNLPILVFNYRTDGNIERAVRGEPIGTRVTSGKN